MLTLKLKAGDRLVIGENIHLLVKEDSSKGRLTIGIDAPREINIARIPMAEKTPKAHKI